MAGYRMNLSWLVFVAMLVSIAVSNAQANRCDMLDRALCKETYVLGADNIYKIAVKLFWYGNSKAVKYWGRIRKLSGACEDRKAIKAWYWLAKHCYRPKQGILMYSMKFDLVKFGSSCAEQIAKYGGDFDRALELIYHPPVY